MREIYIAAAVPLSSGAFSDFPGLAQALRSATGLPIFRAQAAYWLAAGEQAHAGRVEGMACFAWQDQPRLAQFVLHAAARSIQAGDADLVIVVQSGEVETMALVLASPAAVGRYNLAPRARLALLAALPSSPDGVLSAFSKILERARPKEQEPPAEGAEEPEEQIVLPQPGEIAFLAAPAMPPDLTSGPLPHMAWLGAETRTGDLFSLLSLVQRLESERARWGLLLGQNSMFDALATLIERT